MLPFFRSLTLGEGLSSFGGLMGLASVIRGIAVAVCLVAAAGDAVAQAPLSAEASESDAIALLRQGAELEATGQPSKALPLYRNIVRRYPLSPSAPTAQYRLAEILERENRVDAAFEAYQKLIEQYPQSPEFDKAVNAQLAIANSYMDGRRLRLLGIPTVPAPEKAERMYQTILRTAPYAKFAPTVQFNLGQLYERQGDLQKAIAAYQVILDRYPNSDLADDALYQVGYVRMQETIRNSQDLSAAVAARHAFEDFLMQYPNSEKAPQARENLERLAGREAGDLLSIAQFYDRKGAYRAAAIYYSDILRKQPGTEDARKAEQRLGELRAELGDEALRAGPEQVQTGERAAMRRRLQNQVETSALSTYAGPPKRKVEPMEELPAPRPRLRTSQRDVQPMPPAGPAVEPDLPTP